MKLDFKFIIISLLLIGFNFASFAQQDLTIQNMQIVPQSNNNNPANIPTPKVYISFPALSSFYFGLSSSGFAYKDVITRRADDSLAINPDNLLSKMAKTNFLSLNLNEEIFSFGFKLLKKNYFSFSVSTKMTARFAYPLDLFQFLIKGNGAFLGQTADFSGIGINASAYTEYAMGFSRIINKKLTIGIRPKFIYGIANVYTNKSDLSILTDAVDYTINAQGNLRVNSSLDSNFYSNSKNLNPKNVLLNNKNTGYGIDLGAQYEITPKIVVGASIVDLGRITWNANTRNFQTGSMAYSFSGIDLNDFFSKTDTVNPFQKITDSLKKTFKVTENNKSYSTSLPTKIYLTGMFKLTKHDKVGVLFRGELFNNQLYPAYSASLSHQFGNMLNLTASYSILNRSYSNVGVGMALNFGFWQIYLTSDNVLGAMYPTTIKNVIFHFGMNFIFGYKPKKDNEDVPKMAN